MPDSAAPAVSVVMPVYNGAAFLHRAVESLRRQTLADWELLAADDGSADGSADLLDGLAAIDARVRVFRHPANRGVSAARNTAIAHARGHLVAYLDHDDEFYPDHLARAWDWRDKGDVLVFRYHQIEERAGQADYGRVISYDPACRSRFMFHETIAVPLSVVHRPDLFDRAGRFDETLRRDVDGDLWRRFVRAGAKFTFVPAECGLYHVRSDSLSRTTPPAPVWTVEVGSGADLHPLRIPAGEAWRVHQIFDRHEYGGVPVGTFRTPPVVLDVGANVGTFALYAKLVLCRDAVVHCFEPYPPSVELLRQNVVPLPDVTVHPFALGRSDGQADLLLHPTNSGAHSVKPDLVPRAAGRVTVPVRDAGAVWDELGLGEVDVLKVDTEGCEVDILEALGGRLGRVRVVLVEFHTPADRRRIDALLPGHESFGVPPHSVRVGVVKYVRADLLTAAADRPSSPERPSAPVASPLPPPAVPTTDRPRLLFASYHAYLDHSSGAALATRDLFEDLAAHGWDCRAVCGPQLDFEDGRGVPDVLRDHQLAHHVERCAPPTGTRYELFHYTLNGVPVTQYRPGGYDPRRPPTQEEGLPFLDVFARACERFRPDVVLTYGGLPVAPHLIRRAQRRGAKVVFALHNFAYQGADFLREVDAIRVPSEYARRAYQEKTGLAAEAVEWPWGRGRAVAGRADGRYVTFVNPQPVKGVAWFARIAHETARRRPDIQFLVVEGRGGVDMLSRLPLDPTGLRNVRRMPPTPRPADFYARSRVVLVPSLWEETFGRVAAEALANGLPVLASRRGALPETLGGAGLLFDIPEPYTTRMLDVPTAGEVAGWVEAIERLYDDEGFYQAHRRLARERAAAWDPDRLRPGVEAFFRRVAGGGR